MLVRSHLAAVTFAIEFCKMLIAAFIIFLVKSATATSARRSE
jgi:hypothetical protein